MGPERLVFLIPILIPIVAITLGIGIAMLAVYLNYRKRKDIFTLYHQERMVALEKGVEVPPLPDSLLSDEARPYNPRKHLLQGLVWLFVGLGAGVAVWATVSYTWALFGLVFIGIGAAHLIYYAVEGKNEANPAAQPEPTRVAGG